MVCLVRDIDSYLGCVGVLVFFTSIIDLRAVSKRTNLVSLPISILHIQYGDRVWGCSKYIFGKDKVLARACLSFRKINTSKVS